MPEDTEPKSCSQKSCRQKRGKEFYCKICLAECPLKEGYKLKKCGCTFCHEVGGPLLFTPQGKRKDWDALVQWASESSLFLVQLLTLLLSFGQIGKNWKNKHVILLVQKNAKRNYVLNVYLFFGQVNTNSHLSLRQNDLSWTSGPHVFCAPHHHVFSIFLGGGLED